jgi:glutamyl-Q tRNA(Asp) synthetase
VVTRFAPSPTGRLHLGHAYSALLAHDFARGRGGTFLLRIEDIDPGRSRAEHVAAILEDLAWLGVTWDGEVVLQSARLSLYREALARLVRQGLLYPCFCTRKDIAASASAPHGPEGAVYPGTCRRLPLAERERLVAEKPHAWRLDMTAALNLFPGEGRGPGATQSVASALPREFSEGLDPGLRRGTSGGGERLVAALNLFPGEGRGPGAPQSVASALPREHLKELDPGLRRGTLGWLERDRWTPADPSQFGDVVLARKDAPVSYHLAVTVDDAAQGITDVVRGEDLFHATHIHRLLQALLGLPTPRYHHHALITDEQGRRLAKRHGAPTLADLRAGGADPAGLQEMLRSGRLPAGYSAPAT